MEAELIFLDFTEGNLDFPPTYKFDAGTDVYDTRLVYVSVYCTHSSNCVLKSIIIIKIMFASQSVDPYLCEFVSCQNVGHGLVSILGGFIVLEFRLS